MSLLVTSGIGLYFKDYLVSFIVAPLHGEKLIYLTPGGGFSFIFTVCLYFGALLTIPVVMYHIYRFLQPVLGKTSRRMIVSLIVLSCVLATSGATFGYVAAIPAAIGFLTNFAGDAVTSSLTAESYLGFVVAYMLGLAALFQLPLLLFLLDHVKPFPPGALLSSQRFVIAGAIVAAALITPTPDIVNQLIVAGPIILIYQLGAIAVYARRKISRREHVKQNATKTTGNSPVFVAPQIPVSPNVARETPPQLAAAMPQVASVRQSIDGFSRKPPVRQSLAVPQRSIRRTMSDIQRHPSSVPGGQPVHRQIRSLDGISVA